MADFSDLKDIVGAMPQETPAAASAVESPAVEPEPRQPVLDALGRAYATGRRKRARARVWLKPGTGAVVVNGQDQAVYFGRQTHRLIFNQPFFLSGRVGAYDVMATVKGGGSSGQAGALRHGISRALEAYDPTLRPVLKAAGLLTRDARAVERKKVGLHKARRAKQWAKR
ncbi:MAG TPA: 30S ribosomal protein S9 [Rhodospirillaceae bacterium]|jgi:small subunit ribosomal protein S9|nr:30S ribosomal protein S9 [Alphaproteobacteria bacterium]HBH26893.1 30S ribosomal protein S9 [Rhodospirillaceae bacterium]